MCGIAGIYFTEKNHGYEPFAINKFVDTLLKGIEPRGRHATGLVTVGWKGQGIKLQKKPIDATAFVKQRDPIDPNARIILGHTRYATQGKPENNDNNHPVRYKGTYVTHNGVINNDDALFRDEQLRRFAEVDSEIIAALLHGTGIRNPKEALEKLRGGFAIAAIKPGTHPDTLLLARGGSYPLSVYQTKHFIVWASEADVIERAFEKVFLDPEGKPYKSKPNLRTEVIPSGTGWVVKGNKIDKFSFTHTVPFRRSSVSSSSRTSDGWQGIEYWNRASHRDAFEDQVKELRASGQGTAEIMPDFADRTTEQRAKAVWCITCSTSVDRDTTRYHSTYGTICVDCYKFAVEAKPRYTELEPDVLETLEAYCLFEDDVHVSTIRELVKESGYEAETIEYLLFRIPAKFVNRNGKIEKLQRELRERYRSAYEAEWEATKNDLMMTEDVEPVELAYDRNKRLADEQERQKQIEKATEEAKKPTTSEELTKKFRGKLFIACEHHGLVPVIESGSGCPECNAIWDAKKQAREEIEKVDGRPTLPCVVEGCESQTFILRHGFFVCNHNSHDVRNVRYYMVKKGMQQAEKRRVVDKGVALLADRLQKQSVCDVSDIAQREKTMFCYVPKCENRVVATMPVSGSGACHEHARGVKGITYLSRKGNELVMH